jgi:hypothetical protein
VSQGTPRHVARPSLRAKTRPGRPGPTREWRGRMFLYRSILHGYFNPLVFWYQWEYLLTSKDFCFAKIGNGLGHGWSCFFWTIVVGCCGWIEIIYGCENWTSWVELHDKKQKTWSTGYRDVNQYMGRFHVQNHYVFYRNLFNKTP